jgi:hypothetical protein
MVHALSHFQVRCETVERLGLEWAHAYFVGRDD